MALVRSERKPFLTQRLEEDGVPALIKGEKVLTNISEAVQHLQDLCPLDHLRGTPLNSYQTHCVQTFDWYGICMSESVPG